MSNLFEKIKRFNFPQGEYAVFGSGPMCARGLRECRDLDVIASEEIFNECKKGANWELKRLDDNTEYLENDSIELYRNWAPGEWDVKALIANAEIINGISFVRLEEVLKWKKMKAREKDLKDISIIEEYLKRLVE
jgi:hypothetical protein